jgi:nicotinamide mononucleotide transporter
MSEVFQEIYKGLLQTGWIEAIAVIAGIVSVWYSRKENVLVFPTGLVNTTLYIYLSYKGDISRSNTIILFFGLRMQNSSLATFSTSLMRFARARTNSE